MKKVLVINKINSSNLGDQAIGQSIKQLVLKYGYEADCVDLTNAPMQGIRDIQIGPLRPSGDRNKLKILKMAKWYIKHKDSLIEKKIKDSMSSYCAVIIGGGELIQDNNIFPVALYLWIQSIRKANPKVPIYFFGIGVTQDFCAFTKTMLRRAFKSVTKAYVRDNSSQNNLKKVFHMDSVVMPDVVFSSSFPQTQDKRNMALLGVTQVSRLIYYGYFQSQDAYFKHLRQRIEALKEQYAQVQIIFSDNYDRATAKRFQKWLLEHYAEQVELAQYTTLEDMIDLMKLSQHIESPRMHACIIGMLTGCTVNAVEISPKMRTFKSIYFNDGTQTGALMEKVNACFESILHDCN